MLMKYSVSLGNFETLIIRNSAAGKEEEVKVMGSDLQKLTLCDSLICYVLAVNYQQAKAFAPQLHSDCDAEGDKSQKLHLQGVFNLLFMSHVCALTS